MARFVINQKLGVIYGLFWTPTMYRENHVHFCATCYYVYYVN